MLARSVFSVICFAPTVIFWRSGEMPVSSNNCANGNIVTAGADREQHCAFQIQMFVRGHTCDLKSCAGASTCTSTSYFFFCHLTCTDTVAGLSAVIVTIPGAALNLARVRGTR